MATVSVKKPTTPVSTAPKPAPAPATAPTGQDWIRQYLKNKGVADSSIGYTNGQVTFGGGGSIKPTTNVNGQAYAPTADLDKAWNSYQMNQGQQKLGGAQSAYESAVNTPYAAYTAAQPFTYNKDTDPAYQAALQSAQAGAQTASNNAMVSLGSRGIGNSSSNKTAVAQIEQNALGSVTRDVLPQLISQAYQRYADTENQRYQQYTDQYGMSRDHTADLGNIVGMQQGINQQLSAEDQRAIDNAQTQWTDRFNYGNATGQFANGQKTLAAKGQEFDQGMANKTFDRGVLESDRGFNRGVLESDRGYNRGVLESDRNYGRGVYESDRSYNLSKSNANKSSSSAASSQNFNQLMDVWKATGKAPKGLETYGVQQGTAFGADQADSVGKMQDESKGMIDALRSGQLTPSQASQQIDEDMKLGFYTPEEANYLKGQLGVVSSSQPKQTITPSMQQAIDSLPSDKQLDRLWETQGKPKNIGKTDFKDWYRSPDGQLGGVDYNTWKRLYGPQLTGG